MTKRNTSKKKIRVRMQATGENYLVAARALDSDSSLCTLPSKHLVKPRAGVAQLNIALGATDSGEEIAMTLDGHMLLSGKPGAGKSVLLHSIFAQLTFNNTPDDVCLWIIEPKKEFVKYRNHKHVARYVDSWRSSEEPDRPFSDMFYSDIITLLDDLETEWQRRSELFSEYRISTLIAARNSAMQESTHAGTALNEHHLYLPYIVLVIDDIRLFLDSPRSNDDREINGIRERLINLERKSRSMGIYLLLSSSLDVNPYFSSSMVNIVEFSGNRNDRSTFKSYTASFNDSPKFKTYAVNLYHD